MTFIFIISRGCTSGGVYVACIYSYLFACQVRVIVGDLGLCCVYMTSLDH